MRTRRRYQEGGRTADLLRMLEQQQVQKEMQNRMPPPMPMATEPAAAASTGVSMQRPVYTSAADAMRAQSRAGMQTFFGQEYPEFDPTKTQGIESFAPIAEALSPVGDIQAMADAEGPLQLAGAAALAFLPGNLNMFKEWGDFNVMPEMGDKFQKVLDVVGQRGTTRDLVEKNADILRMPESTRRELASNLEDMYDDISGFADQGELDKITEMASILRKGEIPDAKPAVPDIGNFMGEVDEASGLVVRYENKNDPFEYMDVVRSSRDPNDNKYIMNVVAPKSDPLTRGKLMLAGMDKIPVGGVVDFLGDSRGLSNTMSADAYPIMFRFFRKGKAKPLLNEVKYSKLNKLGENSELFGNTFGLDAKDAQYVDMERIPKDVLERIVPKINSKLSEYGIPPVKKGQYGLEFPFFNIERTAKGFDKGGSLRVLKMQGGGKFRAKKYFRKNA